MQQPAASAPKGQNGRRISSRDPIIAIVRMLRPAHRVASDLSYLASGELHDSDRYYEFISNVSARNQSEAKRIRFYVRKQLILLSISHTSRGYDSSMAIHTP